MRGLLDDVEEGVLHDDIADLQELLVQQQPLMVGVVLLRALLLLALVLLALLLLRANSDGRRLVHHGHQGDLLLGEFVDHLLDRWVVEDVPEDVEEDLVE